jgi:hypothetical protein
LKTKTIKLNDFLKKISKFSDRKLKYRAKYAENSRKEEKCEENELWISSLGVYNLAKKKDPGENLLRKTGKKHFSRKDAKTSRIDAKASGTALL